VIYFHVYIIFDFPITYRNASVRCQSECACLYKTVNIVVVLVKINGNNCPKGRARMQTYRVVHITKIWNNGPLRIPVSSAIYSVIHLGVPFTSCIAFIPRIFLIENVSIPSPPLITYKYHVTNDHVTQHAFCKGM